MSSDRIVRDFDSDDIVRLRSHKVVVDPATNTVDVGMLQKTSIICGYSVLPWFTSKVKGDDGVDDAMFTDRWKEFKKIPSHMISDLFKEVAAHNKMTASSSDVEKKSDSSSKDEAPTRT